MPLTPDEQHALRRIEGQLAADDPTLVVYLAGRVSCRRPGIRAFRNVPGCAATDRPGCGGRRTPSRLPSRGCCWFPPPRRRAGGLCTSLAAPAVGDRRTGSYHNRDVGLVVVRPLGYAEVMERPETDDIPTLDDLVLLPFSTRETALAGLEKDRAVIPRRYQRRRRYPEST